ncbi:MAG: heme-dependent oxidative N-demethylase family protein [Acidimicrobiales bacterium]
MPSPHAPAWLDELALEPGPPWLTMGTRGLDPAAWLLADDDRDRELALKVDLLATRHEEVFAALDSPAVDAASAEVLDLVVAAIGAEPDRNLHPLDAAGRLVQEDLCLLVLRDGSPHLDAASLCFPSYWRLRDKLGRPLADVHGPVAHYGDELAVKVDRFLLRLSPDRPVWRRNWSVHDDPALFLPDSTAPREVSVPDELWLRSERQTLRRLATPDVVLFTIRTQQVPLAVLAERPEVARRMATAIAAWSPELAAYKGGHGALLAAEWLRTR